MTLPIFAIEEFLKSLLGMGWISDFCFKAAPSLEDLRGQLGALQLGHGSRSHKRMGEIYCGVQVVAKAGFFVGVDVEHLTDRPILKNTQWLSNKFSISDATSIDVLQEWSMREAAYKALYPHQEAVLLSGFKKAKESLNLNNRQALYWIDTKQGKFSIDAKSFFVENVVVSVALRKVDSFL